MQRSRVTMSFAADGMTTSIGSFVKLYTSLSEKNVVSNRKSKKKQTFIVEGNSHILRLKCQPIFLGNNPNTEKFLA